MKKRFLQPFVLQVLYKGFLQWFLKIIVGVGFGDNRFLKQEEQFIIIANHNSHLDTLSLMASLPGSILWKVKPVAAEDYFGKTKTRAAFSNYFINTLLIRRKMSREPGGNPIDKMLEALDEGYSLILFPEGTRSTTDHMEKMKPGIARVLAARPHIKYVPVYLTGMRESLPKGEMLVLPYKSSVNYGVPTLASSTNVDIIMQQINSDFEAMRTRYQPYIANEDED
ncbi:1-acyl-sn-glycerol-3-phosphate acyltransferase [Dysgonomonas sp. OttesenSCG-928-M03]|nr:1-acyl-sn-glycerol-3-phosphate acyltransferase [Dysgonomonas sp. OttesenSCG-928-M03]